MIFISIYSGSVSVCSDLSTTTYNICDCVTIFGRVVVLK